MTIDRSRTSAHAIDIAVAAAQRMLEEIHEAAQEYDNPSQAKVLFTLVAHAHLVTLCHALMDDNKYMKPIYDKLCAEMKASFEAQRVQCENQQASDGADGHNDTYPACNLFSHRPPVRGQG